MYYHKRSSSCFEYCARNIFSMHFIQKYTSCIITTQQPCLMYYQGPSASCNTVSQQIKAYTSCIYYHCSAAKPNVLSRSVDLLQHSITADKSIHIMYYHGSAAISNILSRSVDLLQHSITADKSIHIMYYHGSAAIYNVLSRSVDLLQHSITADKSIHIMYYHGSAAVSNVLSRSVGLLQHSITADKSIHIVYYLTAKLELSVTPLCTPCAHHVHNNRAISELWRAPQVQNDVHLKFYAEYSSKVHLKFSSSLILVSIFSLNNSKLIGKQFVVRRRELGKFWWERKKEEQGDE